ncbi:LOW QUALITY PROTEIN: auxin response factor 4-like [Macadamia integrifolia]|uniref:LOW QUALITY PROTEIN: auxin response factor 4-like n=1 Tax=Macadamia integrifolia TaxID=60698 RepID=UPI001C52F630|nr:LOW QUALITY PROTEIN: auxin response factor 4-like [Macadamia integrifolia]
MFPFSHVLAFWVVGNFSTKHEFLAIISFLSPPVSPALASCVPLKFLVPFFLYFPSLSSFFCFSFSLLGIIFSLCFILFPFPSRLLTRVFMEIDLNQVLKEGEKSECLGDYDKAGGGICSLSSSSSSSCSSTSSASSVTSSIYLELWHACAGPLTSLPKKGSVVVYFPQGHLEQAASSAPFPCLEIPTFGLQPQIFCRVVNVQLLANKENDEVYTQVTLFPQPGLAERNLEEQCHEEEVGVDDGNGHMLCKSTPHMFCKTLTASDTSTHGGFSVPRRAAEDCFPPLDYKQERPSQELIAKDLHGIEWRFRHIYRGQPRRHLLTTGWSMFVSQKNLVSGDAVLFLRGENGELRLGIRRAGPRNGCPNSIPGNHNMHLNVLSPVANAISTKTMFHVFYSPRGSPAEFVIPHQKYMKSTSNPVSIGTRFKMRFEMEDTAERRCSGVVTGISDVDPYRWPDSKWRCLMVRWDENIARGHQERVSPWEIEPSISLSALSVPSAPRLKKSRISLQSTSPNTPVTEGGTVFLDDESVRSSQVLQGQENVSFISPFYSGEKVDHPVDFEMNNPASQMSTGLEQAISSDFVRTQSSTYTGFEESDRFQKVLQGQEICPQPFLHGRAEVNPNAWEKFGRGCNMSNMYQGANPMIYSFSSNAQSMQMPSNDMHRSSHFPVMHPYMASFQRGSFQINLPSVQRRLPQCTRDEQGNPSSHNPLKEQMPPDSAPAQAPYDTDPKNQKCDTCDETNTGCKLFGFSLAGENPIPNPQSSSRRSCTKVHTQGNLVERAIDLSKLNSYDELLRELEQLFGMEDLLRNRKKGWRLLYTDSENDMIVIGDDPWHNFCNIVSKIHIYTHEEVQKIVVGMVSNDTQSCVEEAPAIMDVSRSSSMEQRNSPVVIRT